MKQKNFKPVIGIPEMGRDNLLRIYLRSKYPAALKKAGATPRWLPWTEDTEKLKQYINECDGFLFPGGADVSPSLYHEQEDPSRTYHRQRDAMEIPLMRMAIESKKPILGICRGCQVMNVAQNGTLHRDIQHISKNETHMDAKGRKNGTHSISVLPNTLLQKVTGSSSFYVNSLHHQAVKDPGNNLIISSNSPAGVPESIELQQHPFCLGVQWHPEHMTSSTENKKIFLAFVQKASL